MVGVIGCYFLYTQSFTHYIALPAITIGLLSAAVLNLNICGIVWLDAKVNKNTLAVVLGGKAVKLYHTLLIIIAFLSALGYFFFTTEKGLDYLPLIAFFPLFLNIITVFKNKEPRGLDSELKKVALSTFLFSVLFFATNFF